MKEKWTPQAGEKRFCKHCGYALVANEIITGWDEYRGTPNVPFIHLPVCNNPRCPRLNPRGFRGANGD